MRFPLTGPDNLPQEGAKHEDLRLDFKRTVDTSDSTELAKDIAAFANSSGGVILVGAAEGKNNTLGKYQPMTQREAGEIKDAYALAVRDRCSPAPIHDAVLIPHDSGWLVAVNVWPFPGQPVGVSRRESGRGDADSAGWCFPMRTGTHAVFLKPEQLPMLMVPEPRRIAVLLDSIPSDRRTNICLVFQFQAGSSTARTDLDLEEVNPLANVAVFRVSQSQPEGRLKLPAAQLLHVPLDGIASVWRTEGGAWSVCLRGTISVLNNKPHYSPR